MCPLFFLNVCAHIFAKLVIFFNKMQIFMEECFLTIRWNWLSDFVVPVRQVLFEYYINRKELPEGFVRNSVEQVVEE